MPWAVLLVTLAGTALIGLRRAPDGQDSRPSPRIAAVGQDDRRGATPRTEADAETSRPAFTSEAGGFSVAFPGEPEEKAETLATPEGPVEIHVFKASGAEAGFVITYTDATPEAARRPRLLLDATRDAAVAQSQGRLLRERRITLGRHSGRELTAEVPFDGDATAGRMRCRIYLVGRRVYQVMAIAPKGKERSDEVEAVFRSFKLAGRR